MPQKRPNLERQLALADEALATWRKVLEEKGVSPKDRRRDPKWRTLNATRRQLKARLDRVAETETLNEEVAVRKAQKAAGGAEEPKKKKDKGKGKGKDKSKDKGQPKQEKKKDKKKEKKGK